MNLTKEQKEKLKTGAIVILGILAFFAITYVVSENTGDRSKDKEAIETKNPLLEQGEVLDEEKQKELVATSMTDLKNLLENQEKRLVMLGTETCYWCIQQKPILKSVAYQYDIEIGYMDLTLLTNEEDAELRSLHESLQAFGTPTFIVVDQGNVADVEVGGMTSSQITELLRQFEMID